MIPYIGDISRADAEVLKSLAERSSDMLDFGVGASTQVLAKYGGKLTSVETESSWIERTKENLNLLGIEKQVDFYQWNGGNVFFDTLPTYDFIFNDGVLSLRKEFAFAAWKHLKIGGILAFHDTRTTEVVKVLANFIEHHSPEIESVFINVDDSNITTITKRSALFYCDWNLDEGRESWQSGYEEVDLKKLKNKLDGFQK